MTVRAEKRECSRCSINTHIIGFNIYSNTFLEGCPTFVIPAGGHDVSDHLVSSHVSSGETTLLSSHRVYTGSSTRTTVADTGVRTNGAPLGAAPQSPHSDRQVHASAHHGAISAHDGPKVTATGRRSFAIHTCSISCLMIIIASAACPSCT